MEILFLHPWAFLSILLFPLLWWLAKIIPPKPTTVIFPPFVFLEKLTRTQVQPLKTPWWMLLLRFLLLFFMILAFAHPIYYKPSLISGSNGKLLIIIEDTWANTLSFPALKQHLKTVVSEAVVQKRAVNLVLLSDIVHQNQSFNQNTVPFIPAREILDNIDNLSPKAQKMSRSHLLEWAKTVSIPDNTQILWVTDGLNHDEKVDNIAGYFQKNPTDIHFFAPSAGNTALSLRMKVSPRKGENINLTALINRPSSADALQRSGSIQAIGTTDQGQDSVLSLTPFTLNAKENFISVPLSFDEGVFQKITHFKLSPYTGTGGVSVLKSQLQEKRIRILDAIHSKDMSPLNNGAYYLKQSFDDPRQGQFIPLSSLEADLKNTDVLIVDDLPALSEKDSHHIQEWTHNGGWLVSFSGASFSRFARQKIEETGQRSSESTPLPLPVLLDTGVRHLGGKISQTTAITLEDFPEKSPFYGLKIPQDLQIKRLLPALPESFMGSRGAEIWATLSDKTPLITANQVGKGMSVMVHTGLDEKWSNLVTTSLFPLMMNGLSRFMTENGRRLFSEFSPNTDGTDAVLKVSPSDILRSSGQLSKATLEEKGIFTVDPKTYRIIPTDNKLSTPSAPVFLPAGIYQNIQTGEAFPVNVVGEKEIVSRLDLKDDYVLHPFSDLKSHTKDYQGLILVAVCCLLLLEGFLSWWNRRWIQGSGHLSGTHKRRRWSLKKAKPLCFLAVVGLFLTGNPQKSGAETPPLTGSADFAKEASYALHLAYIKTGYAEDEKTAFQGLKGLSAVLKQSTAVEPSTPVGVNPDTDDLSFYPFIYWPVRHTQPVLSEKTVQALIQFMETGGVLFIDQIDFKSDIGSSSPSPSSNALYVLQDRLRLPFLMPLTPDHVLSRTFYLLDSPYGRNGKETVWVQATPDEDDEDSDPFQHNDGVSPVIVGAGSWATAWAVDDNNRPVFSVYGDDKVREMAYRFGVNAVMYSLTGNYKSDQIHITPLLERMGKQ